MLEMDRLARECAVVGGQLAVFHDGASACWEFGEEEFGSGRPVGPGSAFAYGSVTKVFTAALAWRLAAEGDLGLDRPVRSWLASTVRSAGHPALSVTLRELLSHTGGLPSDHDAPARSLREWLDGFLASHPVPGTAPWPERGAFSYSNVGYALAGRVIEAATGLPWGEAMRYCLLDPLGGRAGLLPGTSAAEPGLRAFGHSVRAAGRSRSIECAADPGSGPAGGLAGSARDLVRLGLLCLEGRQPPAGLTSLAGMTCPVPGAEPFGLADGWGLGLAAYGPPGHRWAGHDGALDGATCHLRIDPRHGTAVALVANSSTGQALWDEVVGELARAGIPVGAHRPPLPPAGSARSFAECAGVYRNGDLAVVVEAGESGVAIRLPNGVREPVEPRENLTFSVRRKGSPVFLGRFVANADSGRIQALQYSGRTLLPENVPVSSLSTAGGVST
ncbi:serine hydrolase domain-containing protein [Amycolatopsis sp. NPDC004079]|uniref:serine hydrolase domain-containing protein n=1 Tax=Amycolatopsis sp. NPDC004079 TaxID=3154549 RepID=UPI0033A648DE